MLEGLEVLKRGGRREKFVGEKKSFILYLQETKFSSFDEFICSSLWDDSFHGFSFRPSVGLLII